MFHAPDTYTGCRTFAILSHYTGISLDLVSEFYYFTFLPLISLFFNPSLEAEY